MLWITYTIFCCHFTDLLIETAHSADHVASADALVYCVGSLKFLSGTPTVVKHLVKRHCVESMARLLASINNTVSTWRTSHQSILSLESLVSQPTVSHISRLRRTERQLTNSHVLSVYLFLSAALHSMVSCSCIKEIMPKYRAKT